MGIRARIDDPKRNLAQRIRGSRKPVQITDKMCNFYQPCYFVILLVALVLIAAGVVPIVYRNDLDDDIPDGPLRSVFGGEVTPAVLFITGILLIVAGVILLLQSLVRFWILFPGSKCCSSLSERANQEMMWMLYGRASESTVRAQESRRIERKRPALFYAPRRQTPEVEFTEDAGGGEEKLADSMEEKMSIRQEDNRADQQVYQQAPKKQRSPEFIEEMRQMEVAPSKEEAVRPVECLPPKQEEAQAAPIVLMPVQEPVAYQGGGGACQDCVPDCQGCTKRPSQAVATPGRITECAKCCNPTPPVEICGIPLTSPAAEPAAEQRPPPQQSERHLQPHPVRPMVLHKATYQPPSKAHRLKRRVHSVNGRRLHPVVFRSLQRNNNPYATRGCNYCGQNPCVCVQ